MPSCYICEEKAVIKVPYLGEYLCREHFIEYFERKFKLTLIHYSLIKPGDKVAVAVSGGKDSLTTLYLLKKFSHELRFDVFGIAINEGITGYREYKLDALKEISRKMNIRIVIASFKEFFNMTLDDMVNILREKKFEIKPCSICGVFRRYVMNKVAREYGATKLATGHNLDDEIQVYVMNVLKGHFDGIVRETISTPAGEKGLVPRIKPLYFLTEKEILVYTLIKGIKSPFVECPYVIYALRHPVRRWINKVEESIEGFKYKVLTIKELYRGSIGTIQRRTMLCKICGEPSSKTICKTCDYRAYLDPQYKEYVIKSISLD